MNKLKDWSYEVSGKMRGYDIPFHENIPTRYSIILNSNNNSIMLSVVVNSASQIEPILSE